VSGRGRARSRGRSYTARLQRPTAYRPPRTWPHWISGLGRLAGPRPLALLLLAAEAGHLAAALVEWPASPVRGAVHVVTAGVLGTVAVSVYFGTSRIVLWLGIGATLLPPAAWLAGTVARFPPYRDCPFAMVVTVTIVELLAVASLIMRVRSVG
jgi:hypothetical protein